MGHANLVQAQSLPQAQPLVQAGNTVYVGRFTLPMQDGSGASLAWGGAAIGLGPDGHSLYFGCQDGSGQLARVTIPEIGGVSSVVEPCEAVPNLDAINPGDPNGFKLGGSLFWAGRLIVSGYAFYDASHTASSSHFAGPGVASLTGPYRVGGDLPATVGGYMGLVPAEWRTLLGGPALTGKCCTSIISRSSYGPAVSVFDPAHLGSLSAVPSTTLVSYPEAHQTLGAWDAVSPYFTGTMRIAGVAFPGGTRSVLFVGRRGDSFCYGTGAECGDPTNADKGNHGYPYRHVILAYDANDLLAVRQGARNPWDVQPYAQWTLVGMSSNGDADITSAFYDPATRRLYVTPGITGGPPVVHVYEITNAVLQAQAPAPTGLVARTTGGTVTFSWTAPTGAAVAHYRLEAGSSPGAADIGTLALAPGATSVAVPAAVAGIFSVRIVAVYADGVEGTSNEVTVVLGGAAVIGPPVGFSASAAGSRIQLTWNAAANPAELLLDAGTASGRYELAAGAAIGSSGSYVASDVPPGRYFVRARHATPSGAGPATPEIEVVVGPSEVAAPERPLSVRVTVSAPRTVTIAWAADPEGAKATAFVIEAGSQRGVTDVGTLTVPVSTRLDVPGVFPGVYYVRVRSANAQGLSAATTDIRVVVR